MAKGESAPDPRSEKLLAHGRFLRNLARSLVEDDRAEDLVQDTFAVALERPPRHEGALSSWLTSILRRLAATRGRREGERPWREAEAARSEPDEVAPSPDEVAAELEVQRQVFACLQRLREPYRTTLYLRYYRGLEPTAIAEQKGVPVKTVKTRLLRGLDLMRADLDGLYEDRREAWVALLLPVARGARVPLAPTIPASPVAAPLAALAAGALLVAGGIALAIRLPGNEKIHREAGRVSLAPSDAAADTAAQTSLEARGTPAARARRALDAADASWPARASARLEGRVLDAAGGPFFQAEVRVESVAGFGRERGDSMDAAVAVGLTDASGAFEISLPEQGFLRVDIGADGYAPLGRRLIVVESQELDLGTIVLMRGVRLAGHVRDASGQPVAGAEIWQERADEGLALDAGSTRLALVARTDESGAFQVARQAVGPWDLVVRHADHPLASVSGETQVAGESTGELEIELEDGALVSGRLRGTPEPGTRIFVVARSLRRAEGRDRVSGLAGLGRRRIPVRGDGSFAVGGLEADEEVELALEVEETSPGAATDGPRLASRPVRARAGENGVELELAHTLILALVVVDAEDGAPLDGAEARLDLDAQNPRSPDVVRRTGPDGRLRLSYPELESSAVRLAVRAEGYRTRVVEGLGLTGTAEPGCIELERVPRVRIQAVDEATGAPVAGATVAWSATWRAPFGEDLGLRTTVTDESGACELAGDPEQEGTLVVRAPGYASRRLAFPHAAADRPAEVVGLRRGGRVEVVAIDAAGAPLVGRLVLHLDGKQASARGAPDDSTIRPTDGAGRVAWDALAPGLHAFRLSRPGVFRGRPSLDEGTWTEVEVTEGGVATLTLQADPVTSLEARVRLGGVPLPGARVSLRKPAASLGLTSVTDAEGRFALADLSPGEQALEIRHEALGLPIRRAVTLQSGSNQLSVELDPGRVRGRVVDLDGRPLAGARVRFYQTLEGGPEDRSPGRASAEIVTDEAGRFTLEGLDLARPLSFETRAAGRATARTAEVAPWSDEHELEIALGPEARLEVRVQGGARRSLLLTLRPIGAEGSAAQPFFLRPDSRRTFDGLEPGTWHLELFERGRPGAAPAQLALREVELRAGETAEVELTLP